MPDDEKYENNITEEYFMTVNNDAELSIVESILDAEGIPFVKRYLNYGDGARTYLGFSNMGVAIYVSNEDLQKAKDAVYKNSGLENPEI